MTEPVGLVSVLIAAYNAAPHLREAIDSVLTQDYDPLELVLVDDGSEDETEAIARSYGERVRFERQEHLGIGAGRNHTVRMARGEFFSFVDADDRLLPGAIDKAVAALRDAPELEAVFFGVQEFLSDEVDDEARERLRAPRSNIQARLPNAMVIRDPAFFRVGEFDASLRRAVTVDWLARAAEHDLRFEILPEVLLERRLHAENQGMRKPEAQTDYARVLKASIDRRRRGG